MTYCKRFRVVYGDLYAEILYMKVFSYLNFNIYLIFTNLLLHVQDEELIVAIDPDGRFTEKVSDFQGRYVKDSDKDIIHTVKARFTIMNHTCYLHFFSATC